MLWLLKIVLRTYTGESLLDCSYVHLCVLLERQEIRATGRKAGRAPAVATEDRPPFLKKGECYIAGSAGWCAFAPSFAGAEGLLEMCAVDNIPLEQKEFHLFRQLPRSRNAFPMTAYHGKNAVGGYLYLGTYTVPDHNDITFISFKDHPLLTQYSHADWDVRVCKVKAKDMFYSDKQIRPYTVVDNLMAEFEDTEAKKKKVTIEKTVQDDLGEDEDADDARLLTFDKYYELHKCGVLNSRDKAAWLRRLRTAIMQRYVVRLSLQPKIKLLLSFYQTLSRVPSVYLVVLPANVVLVSAFVLGTPADSELRMRAIHDCERVLCASPAYLEEHGFPECGADLVREHHHCLLLRFPGANEFHWTLGGPRGAKRYEVSGPFESDDGDVLTDWALAGAGIVNKPRFEVAEHLASGRLVEVCRETPPLPVRLACLYPHKRYEDPKIRIFADFVAERCRAALSRPLPDPAGA